VAGPRGRYPQERSGHLLHLQSPKKRLKWNNESMEKALQVVKDGQCKIKEAAREFNVPRTTLQDLSVDGVKPGPKPYLDEAEESELAELFHLWGMERPKNKLWK